MRLQLFALLIFTSLAAAQTTYPTKPVNSTVGKLACGVRLVDVDRVQTWCYWHSPTGVLLLPYNTIATVTQGDVSITGYIRGADQMLWIVSKLGLSGHVDYQISVNGGGYKAGVLAAIKQLAPLPALALAEACDWICCIHRTPLDDPYWLDVVMARTNCQAR